VSSARCRKGPGRPASVRVVAASILVGLSIAVWTVGCAAQRGRPFGAAEQPSAAQAVTVWTETLTLPTYEVSEDPIPRLQATDHVKFYPYPAQWDIAPRPRQRTWRVVCMENRYLKVVIMPDLGGRLFALYDKVGGFDAIYRQKSVKPARVGIRGAWICGGIEYNFPDSHSVTTHDKVHWTMRHYPDGSAGILIGDVERISRMAWTVEFRLCPDRAYLEDRIYLHNRTPLPQRYFYWTNAAVEATDQTQVIFPFPKVTGHSGRRLLDWPIRGGIDWSWYRYYKHATSTFGIGGRESFIGAYDHGKGVGVVHYADRRLLPGRKFWTWGTSPAGLRWAEVLSDDKRPYIELQAGPLVTQSEYAWMRPYEVHRYNEFWIPVSRIGPFARANPDAVVRLTVDQQAAEATVGVLATRRISGAAVEVYAGDRLLRRWKADLAPERPFLKTVALRGRSAGNIRLVVLDGAGREVISHTYGKYAVEEDKPLQPPAKSRTAKTSASEPARAVARFESQWLAARYADAAETIEKALASWPEDPAVRVAGGVFRIRQGLYEQAIDLLRPVAERGDHLGWQGRFYLAVALLEAGRAADAAGMLRGLSDAPPSPLDRQAWRRAKPVLLARALMLAGDFEGALDALEGILTSDSDYTYGAALAACAARRAGLLQAAETIVQRYLQMPDLEPMARAEAQLVTGEPDETLCRMLQRDPEVSIELACDYIAVGDLATAQAVLTGLLAENSRSAMTWLLAAWCAERMGQKSLAALYRQRAERLPTDFVFPSRPEELQAALAAVRADPDGAARAAYYAGLVLMRWMRYDEAIEMWQKAIAIRDDNALARRCLGVSLWRVKGKPAEAVAHLRRAVEIRPEIADLHLDLAALLGHLGRLEERLAVLRDAAGTAAANDRIVHELGLAYMAVGRFDDAVRTFAEHKFNVAEGRYELHDHYAAAWVAVGLERLLKGQVASALEALDKALEYPANLAIGRPAEPNDEAMIQFWRGVVLGRLRREAEATAAFKEAARQRVGGWRLRPGRWYPLLNAVHNVLAERLLGDVSGSNGQLRLLQGRVRAASRWGEWASGWAKVGQAWLEVLKGEGGGVSAMKSVLHDGRAAFWARLSIMCLEGLEKFGPEGLLQEVPSQPETPANRNSAG